jgi:hypothetical protein
MAPKEETKRGNLPPYISFKTLTNFLGKLKESAVPGRIDSSVLHSFAGSVARQLVLALKFLKLIESSGSTTEKLKTLVKAYGTPDWKEELGSMIHESYTNVVSNLDLDTGTYQQLLEAFRNSGADGVVLERAVSFYLTAIAEAGQTVSPHFTNRPRRAKADKPRVKKKAAEEEDDLPLDPLVPHDEMAKFVLPIPGKHNATIMLPVDLTSEDWNMISTMMQAYVARLQKAAS